MDARTGLLVVALAACGRSSASQDARPQALVVRLIDAETGAPVCGGKAIVYGGEAGGGTLLAHPLTPAADGSFRLAEFPFVRGVWADPWIKVTDVPGHADVESYTRAGGTPVSTVADAIEWTVPIWPEADVVVEVVDPSGAPLSGCTVRSAALGDDNPFRHECVDGLRTVERSTGFFVVHGVPFVRNTSVVLEVDHGIAFDVGRGKFGAVPTDRLTLRVVLDPVKSRNATFSGGGGSFPGCSGDAPHGLRAADGPTSVVTVVDETGRPLPGATIGDVVFLASLQTAALHVENGVQRWTFVTDADGRCALHGLAPGSTAVSAHWRGREGTVRFVAGEDARIVLAPR